MKVVRMHCAFFLQEEPKINGSADYLEIRNKG